MTPVVVWLVVIGAALAWLFWAFSRPGPWPRHIYFPGPPGQNSCDSG